MQAITETANALNFISSSGAATHFIALSCPDQGNCYADSLFSFISAQKSIASVHLDEVMEFAMDLQKICSAAVPISDLRISTFLASALPSDWVIFRTLAQQFASKVEDFLILNRCTTVKSVFMSIRESEPFK
jgi:hypothetical protein